MERAGQRRGRGRLDPLPTTPVGRWAPDPTGRHQWRIWTGSNWAEEVNDDGVVTIDPPVLLPPGDYENNEPVRVSTPVRSELAGASPASTRRKTLPQRCVEGHDNTEGATTCSICRLPLSVGTESALGDMLDVQDSECVYDLSDFAPPARSALLTELRQRGIAHRWVKTQGRNGVNDLVVPVLAEAEADALVEQYAPGAE